jgi:hypothetical protein
MPCAVMTSAMEQPRIWLKKAEADTVQAAAG